MILRGLDLKSLTLSHLQGLVDNRVAEGRDLEYKLDLPSNSDSEKKEFLADVSAMANTTGGLIIFGMATEREEGGRDTGVANSCEGISLPNPDAAILRLSAILRDSLDPQLTLGVGFHSIPAAAPGRHMLLLGIEKSLIGPHRVVYQHSDKFWRRGPGGKYSPDTPELRRMFMEADSWAQEATRFHEERLSEIRRYGTYSHFCLVHVLPLGRLTTSLHPRIYTPDLVISAGPMIAVGADWRYNAAGFRVHNNITDARKEHYVQWFRFGGVEAVASSFVFPSETGIVPKTSLKLLRPAVSTFVHMARQVIRDKLKVGPPYFLALSLSGIGQTLPDLGGIGSSYGASAADQDPVTFPPIILQGEETPTTALQLWWDTLWQVFGYPQAPD